MERKPFRFFARLFLLLRWLLLIALSLACVAIFYIAVVMGEIPEQDQAGALVASTPMPSAAPLPGAVRSVDSVDLAQLQALFPAPLATLPTGQGFVLQSGKAEDVRVSGTGRICRVVSLTYSHATLPSEVVVRSATPGAYVARYAQGAFTLQQGTITMGKLPAMVLTAREVRSFVAVQGEVVYAVEGPDAMAGLDNVPGYVTVAEL